MTDLLARLAARHLGQARLLQPQLPGLFEPQGDTGQALVEETVERTAPSPRAAPETPPEPVTRPQDTTTVPPRPADQVRHADPEPAPIERVLPRVEDAPEPPPVQHVTHETQREVVQETQRITHLDHLRTTDREARTPPPDDRRPATNPDAPRTDPPATAKQQEAHRDPPKNIEPLPQPVVQTMARQDPATPHVEFPPAPERKVEVHIGHLEIRTTTPPKPKARPRTSPANPAPDLNTYLGGRS